MAPRAPSPAPQGFLRPELRRDPSANSKFSVPSSSQSNEADDEESISDLSYIMGPDAHIRRRRYAGEDTRLTSKKELSGFYMYGWAAEVFVVCGIGSFIPITLEQLARERGVLLPDKTTPCSVSFHVDPPGASSFLQRAPKPDPGQCVVYILGAEINTASFAMYTFSISVLVQALLIISMSGAADHGRFRKTLLLWFAFIGAAATMCFLPIVPKVYLLGAFLAIIANTCFGASFVLLNSFLPLLVRHHPTIQYAYPENSDGESFVDGEDIDGLNDPSLIREARYSNDLADDEPVLDEIVDATTALLPGSRPGEHRTVPNPRSSATPYQELALSTKISSTGVGIGYIAALLVQTISIFIVILTKSTTFSLRLVLFIVGAWWFIFTIPAALWLRPRPGPPLDLSHTTNLRACLAYMTHAWKSLGRSIMHARKLKDVLLFLAAWFLLSDSIATVSGTAVLFAKTSLEMKPAALALINVIATMSGIVGAFSWSRLSIWMGLKPSQTILACIFLFEIIPIYGLLGYIPVIQRLGVFGLQQPWEMYPLGAVYGFVLGGLSSYCRSLFGELIPPGFEAAFYALYAITDKGSSVFGPAIVGAITDRYGGIRPAFWFLAVLIGLPFPIMCFVDVDRGRAEGIALAKELEGRGKDMETPEGEVDERDDNVSRSAEEDY